MEKGGGAVSWWPLREEGRAEEPGMMGHASWL